MLRISVQSFSRLVISAVVVIGLISPISAAERTRVEDFLKITGFDVALDSIALSAGMAPEMLGLQENAFGSDWTRLAEDVFDETEMREEALGLLERGLDDVLLEHTLDFYGSDLGQRIVNAENLAHLDDDEVKQIAGEHIIAAMVRVGDPKVQYFKRMNIAIDPSDTGVRAVQEVQVRFLLAAATSGVINLKVDEGALRALMKEREAELRLSMQRSALKTAGFTYQEFSADEVLAYTEALEDKKMQTVYELMNAVHFEIMARRFETLAHKMKDLHPGEDL